MARLILVRHGKSEWNSLGKWTGLIDIGLADEGKEEARRAADILREIPFTRVYTSLLKRAKETYEEIQKVLEAPHVPIEHPALNERDYGVYTGKKKWEVKQEIGDKAFMELRRGWDVPIPEGESLKDVHARVIPYYKESIHADLLSGHHVMVVAHGNSLRALIKHLEDIPDEEISNLELGTGAVYVYDFNENGEVQGKSVLGDSVAP
jgi:2,3-bisphosphoglycerate-dependent phosphoglycerate mutase